MHFLEKHGLNCRFLKKRDFWHKNWPPNAISTDYLAKMADMDQELAKIDQNMECDSIAHWPSLLGFACTKHLLIFVLNHFYKKKNK